MERKEDRNEMKKEDSSLKDMEYEKENSSVAKWINKLHSLGITQDKKEKVVIAFLLGVFFLLIATPVSTISETQEKKETQNAKPKVQMNEINEKDAYIEKLENKLEQTIRGMEGAGEVFVMITLKDSGEKILDKNQPYESSSEKSKEEGKETEQSNIKSEQQTVLIEEDGNTLPIIVQELYPNIEGVVVICEGGNNSELALRIKEVVQALFSIDTHKIVVCKLQTESYINLESRDVYEKNI